MVSKEEKWIRIFDVSDVSRHKKGFTIYKVVSMLYPESCPDAITKITVWKRYNDFKKLHREMKTLHRSMGLKDKYPTLPSSSFFSRFDDEVIQNRRQLILTFLEYVSVHSQLFTSNCFVKFFETSHTPYTMLNSSINSIRAELNLPAEPEYLSFHSPDSDNEGTLSDTDSVSTRSSLSSYVQINDYCNDCMNKSSSSLASLSKRFGNESSTHAPKINRSNSSIDSYNTSRSLRRSVSCNGSIKENDNLSVSNIDVSLEDCGLSETLDKQGSLDRYVDKAERIIRSGLKLEEEERFAEAFDAFKEGIGILLDHGRGDKDFDRRESVRHKIEKYLLRAEKIHNLHLSSESKLVVPKASAPNQRPVSDLYKLKVLKIIGSGMLVLHSELQQLFYVKVIYKSSFFNDDDMILPAQVPYMVRMHNFYNCENALFLVLEYNSGLKLWDYIRQRSPRMGKSPSSGDRLHETKAEPSEDGSECSFSELVNDYIRNVPPPSKPVFADRNMNVDEMVAESQKLLSSVDATLQRNAEMRRTLEADGFEIVDAPRRRKTSEVSCGGDDCEIERNEDVPAEKVVVWAAQLLIALEELHRLGIICCDIQTKNLLIDENDDVVLTYVCKVNGRRKVHNYRNIVTLAPETYRFDTPTTAVDWWCYGTILYELLVGVPLSRTHPEGILCSTMLKVPKFVSAEGRSLLKQLLVYDPQSRLGSGGNGAEEIKSHPFFSTVDWKALKSKGNG